MELTPASKETFILYAEDAGNWSGYPWVSVGNIGPTKAQRGNITDLNKKGLIEIGDDDGDKFISFTEAGKAYAKSIGIDLDWV
jgi:hypothetical protein